ncbi:MAG: DUF6259 domain-containing protein [Armatimonadota bacterium]
MRSMLSSVVILTLFLAVVSVSCAESVPLVEKSLTASFTQGKQVDLNNDHLRLRYEYAQDNPASITMEAERATVIRFTADKGVMGSDAKASGGHYIAYVDHMEFHFTAKEAGRYTAWYRGSYPFAGTWCHMENMDGGQSQTLIDSQGIVTNQWLWSKGPTYTLAAGKHAWNFTPAGWCGGTKLDKVVLVKEGTPAPTELGGKASAITSPLTGEAISEPISRRDAVRWLGFTLTNAVAGSPVSAAYSVDNGGQWTLLGDKPASLPIDKPFILKLTLTATPEGMTPYVTGAKLIYGVKRVPELVLENAGARFRFSGENGALLGITNKRTKTEYLAPGVEVPLFTFMALRGDYGTLREIGFTQAELKKVTGPAKGALRLQYELMGGGIQADLKITLEKSGLARFSMQVANKSIYNIALVKFPVLKGARIGDDPSDDYLFTPILSGGIAKYPASMKMPRIAYSDRPLVYPGQGSMCWMDLWDAKGGGLYLAFEDKDYRLTELACTPGTEEAATGGSTAPLLPQQQGGYKYADKPGPFINFGFVKRLRISKETGPVQVPDMVIGVHQGDWHWGADRYREWAESWMVKTPVPDWYRDTDGYVDVHMTHLGTFVDLPKGHMYGNRTMSLADPPFPLFTAWAQMASSEAHWSGQVLHLLLGNEEEFAGSIQQQHEMGHRMSFYNLPPRVNPLFFQGGTRLGVVPISMYSDDVVPPKGFYPEVGLRHFDGSLESPDGVYSEAGCCLGATKWRDYLSHIVVDKYARQYGADGMYLDGIGLVTYDCANLKHGHAGYGEWSVGLNQWMAHVKSETRKVRPGAVFFGEGMADVDHRYLDGGLFYFDNAPQVYRYTFPRNIGILHTYLPEYYKEFPSKDSPFEFVIVYGIKFGCLGISYAMTPERFAQMTAFRRLFSQFQNRARFMDDQGLLLADGEIKAKLYCREEPGTKGAMVVAFNEKEKAGVPVGVDVERVGRCTAAWAYTLDGTPQRVEVRKEGGQYRFTLPASRLSAVLLADKCEPFVDLAHVDPVTPGGRGTARVTVRNLEAKPISGTVMLQLPAGWESDRAPFSIAPGAGAEFTLGFTVSAGAKYDVHDIYAVARERWRETKKCLPMGVCRPVQAQIHYLTGDTVRVDMVNMSDREIAGSCRLVTPPAVTADAPQAFALPAKGKGSLTFRMRNVAAITTREHIKAIMTYGEETTTAYELLQPPIVNGNFEQCLAGDGLPDYWNYRQPQSLYLKGYALDPKDPFEGKYSLRLDPNADQTGQNYLGSTLLRLAPNTKYRFSARIRRTADQPGIGLHLFSFDVNPKAKGSYVSVSLGSKPVGPLGSWDRYEAVFTTGPLVVPHEILALNASRSTATVWFDDIRIEEIK